jgi:hypothetical protein
MSERITITIINIKTTVTFKKKLGKLLFTQPQNYCNQVSLSLQFPFKLGWIGIRLDILFWLALGRFLVMSVEKTILDRYLVWQN